MKLAACSLLVLLLSATLPSGAFAQAGPILSPRDSVTLAMDTNTVSVNYGRPSTRGRTIMGDLVPWEKVWRTGANQATHLRTNFDMTFGDVPVTRGTYTLFTIPSRDEWVVILNKQTGQWGTRYDERQDLARFKVEAEALDKPVDTFTVSLRQTGSTAGELALAWERTRVTIPFEKNTGIRPLSPADSAQTTLNGKKVAVRYSAPYMRGRTIWGVVVPWDSVWRTGANQGTSLETQTGLALGDSRIPAGSYVLRSLPAKDSFTLIVSRRGDGEPIPDSLVVARVPMKMEQAEDPIERFKIWFEEEGDEGATLKLGWADRVYSVAIVPR
jgi:hypothetical protein